MSRFRHAVKDRDQHIQTLRIACAVLTFFSFIHLCRLDAGIQQADRT